MKLKEPKTVQQKKHLYKLLDSFSENELNFIKNFMEFLKKSKYEKEEVFLKSLLNAEYDNNELNVKTLSDIKKAKEEVKKKKYSSLKDVMKEFDA